MLYEFYLNVEKNKPTKQNKRRTARDSITFFRAFSGNERSLGGQGPAWWQLRLGDCADGSASEQEPGLWAGFSDSYFGVLSAGGLPWNQRPGKQSIHVSETHPKPPPSRPDASPSKHYLHAALGLCYQPLPQDAANQIQVSISPSANAFIDGSLVICL